MPNRECTFALKNDTEVEYTSANKTPFKADIALDELTKELLGHFDYWVGAKDSPFGRKELELLGRILYQVLLPSEKPSQVREQFENDLALFWKEKGDDDRFRITLELHENAKELYKYPWEFLFLPPIVSDKGFFLAGEKTELILTRFVPKLPQKINIKTEEPLRILVIFSHPKELPDIKSQLTLDVIKDIKQLESLDHIEVRMEENPTRDGLYNLMNLKNEPGDAGKKPEERARFKPDILHFIGHGEPGKLALFRKEEEIQADEDAGKGRSEAHWCVSAEVLKLFSNHTPHMVFLHACDGAKPTSVQGFRDLARDLVYAQVPIVVAMQYSIKNKDAGLFARKFYEEIRNGSLIDEAVRSGREALGSQAAQSWGDRSFGTPVVYMRKDSQMAIANFPRTEKQEQSNDQTPRYNPSARVPCPNPKCIDSMLTLDTTLCLACLHDVMLCPSCENNNIYGLMDKTKGQCGRCKYKLSERQVGQVTAGEAPRPEKEETRPSATPPPQRPIADTSLFAPQQGQSGQGVQVPSETPERGR